MENKTPRYTDTNELIRLYNLWIGQLQDPEDAGALEGVQACLDVLLDQPVVDAVPVVHGKWEELSEADYKCSRCGFRFTSADPISMFQYCRCGAKMDGDVNG